MYIHFPGFNAFREASKFYFLIALGYSVLIAAFIDVVWKNKSSILRNTSIKLVIVFIVIILFVANTKPVLTQEIGSLFVARQIPGDYKKLENVISQKNNYFRTLWIPIDSRWSIYANNHPKLGLITEINANWFSFIQGKILAKDDIPAERMTDFMKLHEANQLLNMSSIEYIIVPLEDKANDDNFFPDYGKNRQFYIDQLSKISYLHKINVGTKNLVIYENKNSRPHIYVTNNQETISKEQGYKVIDYEFVNPTEYKFSVKNVSNSFYLNFSESYHLDWEMRIGGFNWKDALTEKNYFISDKYHFQNDAFLNSYFLNPKSICTQFICKQNKDGSYDISGTLYFRPQSYMYLGMIVSGATLIVVIGYLFFVFGRNIYERKNK